MIHPTIIIEQPQESAPQEPASNADVTQHQPQTGTDWMQWILVAAAALTVWNYINK